MTTRTPKVTDQVNVITLKCAQDWHKAFKDQNDKGFAPGDFPPSIVVPFADIEQIVNDFRDSVNVNVNGVRIYFIIKPVKKPNGRPNISCICVPTKGPHDLSRDTTFTDIVINATLKEGAPPNRDCQGSSTRTSGKERISAASVDSEEEYSSIYDVTRPCPPYCDPDSPINEG